MTRLKRTETEASSEQRETTPCTAETAGYQRCVPELDLERPLTADRELVKTYNEMFNSTRPREYDGSHIRFGGMNPDIKLSITSVKCYCSCSLWR